MADYIVGLQIHSAKKESNKEVKKGSTSKAPRTSTKRQTATKKEQSTKSASE